MRESGNNYVTRGSSYKYDTRGRATRTVRGEVAKGTTGRREVVIGMAQWVVAEFSRLV